MGKLHDAMQMSVSAMLRRQGWASVMEIPLPHCQNFRCDIVCFKHEELQVVGVEVKTSVEHDIHNRYQRRIEDGGAPVAIAALKPHAERYAEMCPDHWGIISMEPVDMHRLAFRNRWLRSPVLTAQSSHTLIEMMSIALGRLGDRQVARQKNRLSKHREAVMKSAWRKM